VLSLLSACAGPQTQLGSVSQDQIVIEQARQQQFALETALKQRSRLQNVANPLLRAAVPFCREKVRPSAGYAVGNAYLWQKDYFKAALSLGFSDTLTVMNVTPGLPADDAGLKTGDRILAVNAAPVVTGPRAVTEFESKLPGAKDKSPIPYTLTYRRGSETKTVDVATEMTCAYNPQLVESDEINAYADGRSIFITTGILRFVADDNELAVVLGHELAHDAMRHIDAMSKNTMVGALLGAIVDVAAATQGVNTQGDFMKQGAQLGSLVFSQDFEREADYVGLYIMALANLPIEDAPTIWRRMAAAHPGSIKFATSHPTTAERFVRLDKWRQEIDRKVALGLPLRPEMKSGNTTFANSFGVVPTKTALTRPAAKSAKSNEAAQALQTPSDRTPLEPASPAKAKSDTTKDSRVMTLPSRASRSTASATLEPVPDGVAAQAIIGAPTSESDRAAAVVAFEEANAYMGSHQWSKAEESFRQTVRLDGSVAKYHAGLGSVLMLLQKWKDAEAEYTAAVLLDLDNPVYRHLVKEARSKR
jgi:predicted Zn-dependent protease